MKKRKHEDKLILTASEMAEVLSISVSQVRRLIKSSGMPFVQLKKRGRLFFNKTVVLSWFDKHQSGAGK